jgi:hypothetical protein
MSECNQALESLSVNTPPALKLRVTANSRIDRPCGRLKPQVGLSTAKPNSPGCCLSELDRTRIRRTSTRVCCNPSYGRLGCVQHQATLIRRQKAGGLRIHLSETLNQQRTSPDAAGAAPFAAITPAVIIAAGEAASTMRRIRYRCAGRVAAQICPCCPQRQPAPCHPEDCLAPNRHAGNA